jgi:hypothetical protein
MTATRSGESSGAVEEGAVEEDEAEEGEADIAVSRFSRSLATVVGTSSNLQRAL